MRLVDSHCHFDRADSAYVNAALERARAAGLVHAVIVGQFQGPGDWGIALEVAAAHPEFLTATLGIHPHEAARATEADFEHLERTCARPEIHAVGEAGLDYYYEHSARDVQREVFRRQCALAKRLGKPLVVHVRESTKGGDAHPECEAILKEEGMSRGVIHCFTGDTEAARRYLDLGFLLSLSGVVTYKKTEALQDAVRFAPLERLMVETDSPYLAPIPYRGKKNEPSYVIETAKKVAELKGVTLERVAEVTTANAAALFGFTV
ncbi:TatD DNase family protein [Archangium gephyra]|uniref:Deoxyribonuclease YcfH n=1 Tax=Archangium gephyra TaxID=48 RepID=A0AAC8QCI8_9BACT|nr:TatD family hydrolase [Archangium gephyra]AKJ05212.1 Putative deoxyribonuclease YcfH [Archangium gephyra]REG35906.1 TatD DNase family protein [Archangium gephyra]